MGLTAASPVDAANAVTRALVVRAQNGDAEAFGELIEDHYDMIHRTAWKWCGNRADAEDIAQDVCVKLGSAIAGFNGRSAFSSWVYRITLNAVRKLPEKQRDAVLLVYAEELSHAAAAEIMGIKEATVSFHVHEARKTLRGLL